MFMMIFLKSEYITPLAPRTLKWLSHIAVLNNIAVRNRMPNERTSKSGGYGGKQNYGAKQVHKSLLEMDFAQDLHGMRGRRHEKDEADGKPATEDTNQASRNA
jgi:hypothetical protein